MVSNIVATFEGIDEAQLSKLRGQCVEALKHTNGALRFEDVLKTQQGV